MMAIPYHLLEVCGSIIFAARGSDIHSFTSTFEHISTWEYPVKQREASCAPSPAAQESPAPEEPPAKRRKVQDGQESTSKGQVNGPKATQEKVVNERPFIQGLYVTTDGHHLVAITGSDKTIWVFEHDGAGNLKQLSQRTMPKRPCALALTADNRTILSADKFGDVYALPLIPSNSPSTSPLPPQNFNRSRSSLTPTPSPGPAAALKPQANELTVHTKRNLIALENQKKSLSRKSAEQQSQSSGATPSFEHALLLGHVSMLTAICVATLTTTTTTTSSSISLSNDGQQQPQQQPETRTPTTAKEYILTADRDEHIRVSRGMPQSHVIEGFCLGHDEFVSRLCVAPGGRERVLISGGGDDDLFVWDWPAGRLLCRAGLAGHVKDAMVLVPSGGDGDGGDGNGNGDGQGAGGKQVKVAVTKLLASRWTGCETVVFVACERVPAIFCYNLLDDNTLRHRETVGLPGNPLDVELLGAGRLLVAVDSVTSGEGSSAASSLMVLDQQQAGSEGEAGWRHTPVVPTNESAGGAADINLSTEELQKILYTTESLRKMTDSD